MRLLPLHVTKTLLLAWRRFRLLRGEKLTSANLVKARANKTHHHHGALLQLP